MVHVTRRVGVAVRGLPALRSPKANQAGSCRGMSLIELMVVLGVVATGLGMALPALLVTRDDSVARQATAYVVGQMTLARSQAARHGAAVGIRFEENAGDFHLSKYIDGDGDGIRTRDIADGVDQPLESVHALSDHYPAVRIGFADSVPPIDGALRGSGSDPVRFGPGDILTFGPVGTATSGTVYLAGPGQRQYAVRVLGTTGRLRVMRFDQRSRRWTDR